MKLIFFHFFSSSQDCKKMISFSFIFVHSIHSSLYFLIILVENVLHENFFFHSLINIDLMSSLLITCIYRLLLFTHDRLWCVVFILTNSTMQTMNISNTLRIPHFSIIWIDFLHISLSWS